MTATTERPAFWAGLGTQRRYSYAEVAEANNFDMEDIAANDPDLLKPLTPSADYYLLREVPLASISMPFDASFLFNLSNELVDSLALAYQQGEAVPPVIVSSTYQDMYEWSDGQHRLNAAYAIGLTTVPAFILMEGDKRA